MEVDDVARLAQKYTEKVPVIALGCGTSIPHGLPSMQGLAVELLERLDIHDDTWNKFKGMLEETKDLEKSLHEVPLSDPLLAQVVEETWRITAEIDFQVYVKMIVEPQTLALSRLFGYFLRTANPKISVVTTNYDRLAEYAANTAKAEVLTGFTSGWIQRFVPNSEKCVSSHCRPGFEGRVEVLKIHGSLDWFIGPAQVPIAIPLAQEIPTNCKPLIVTPGVSKYFETTQEPFRTVMTWSDRALENATCYLCIGFGFNDKHFQPKLVNRVRQDNIPIVIVTKDLTEAAHGAFLDNPPRHFLILEENESGTKVYCPECPSGEVLADYSIWDLPRFIDMLLGEKGPSNDTV